MKECCKPTLIQKYTFQYISRTLISRNIEIIYVSQEGYFPYYMYNSLLSNYSIFIVP